MLIVVLSAGKDRASIAGSVWTGINVVVAYVAGRGCGHAYRLAGAHRDYRAMPGAHVMADLAASHVHSSSRVSHASRHGGPDALATILRIANRSHPKSGRGNHDRPPAR